MSKRLKAEHGVIYSRGNDTLFGYFGWPSVCRHAEHGLMAAASGFRTGHVDPFGKSIVFYSEDDGVSWGGPEIVNDSPIDDRDTGLTALGGGRTMLSWFSSDTRRVLADRRKAHFDTRRLRLDISPVVDSWEESTVAANVGSFTRIREASGEWGRRRIAPLSAPHGPIRRSDGTLLYLGNECGYDPAEFGIKMGQVMAAVSGDDGESWQIVGEIPPPDHGEFCEPHIVELGNGEIVGALRYQPDFSLFITRSSDGGATWSRPEFLAAGSPPSLLLHSSGVVVMSYSWRFERPGQRMAFSSDGGRSWDAEWILRDDGPDHDLGYPSTVELSDGSLYTVYYQKTELGALNCSLLSSHWTLPMA